MSDRTPRILVDRQEPIAVVTLNEPEARNPLSPQLVREATAALTALASDEAVRAVVITGAGPAFCAGADIRRFRVMTAQEDREEYGEILQLNRLLWNYPKPTIAAVHGHALGAGANLVGWCDLAVADETARIGYPEVKAGVASATVVATLLRLVGRKRLNELVLTGDLLTAHEAERLGLVNRVVPAGQALHVACDLARRIAQLSPSAVRLTKEVIRVTTDLEYDKALEYARDVRVISRMDPAFQQRLEQYMQSDRSRGG